MDYYLLFFINIATRRVIMSPPTPHPDAEWVAQQARNFTMEVEEMDLEATDLIHDCDTKFTRQFDFFLKAEGIRTYRHGPAQPNMNAYAERFVQTIQQECLDHFIILGEKHLNHILHEFLVHYHEERPHQALGNEPPVPVPLGQGEVACRERLGGLLKHYYRAAA